MIVPRLRQIQAVAGGDLMDMLIVVSIEDMPINEEDYCEEIEESPLRGHFSELDDKNLALPTHSSHCHSNDLSVSPRKRLLQLPDYEYIWNAKPKDKTIDGNLGAYFYG